MNTTAAVLGRRVKTAGSRPDVNVFMAFRKSERGSGEECFSHTVEETSRLTVLASPSEILSPYHLHQGRFIWLPHIKNIEYQVLSMQQIMTQL